MKALNKYFITIICCLILTDSLKAQADLSFSSRPADLQYYNPAYGGFDYGTNISTAYSNFWSGDVMFNTFRMAVDGKASILRGSYLINSEVDFNNFNSSFGNIRLAYAYDLAFTRSIYLKPSLSIGYFHNKTDYSLFTTRYKIGESTLFLSDDIAKSDFLGIDAGLVVYTSKFHFGFSTANINCPKESHLRDSDFKLPVKYSIIVGNKFEIGNKDLNIAALYQTQKGRYYNIITDSYLIEKYNLLALHTELSGWQYRVGAAIKYISNSCVLYGINIGYKGLMCDINYYFDFVTQLPNSSVTGIGFQNRIAIQFKIFGYTSASPGRYSRALGCPSYYSSSSSPNTNSNAAIYGKNDYMGGVLTAGEINDLAKWELWSGLSSEILDASRLIWKVEPYERFSVQLINQDNKALCDVKISLITKKGETVWVSRTDNAGKAEMWNGMLNQKQTGDLNLVVESDGKNIVFDNPLTFESGINVLRIDQECKEKKSADILFVVDATASMDDEINYLKAELNNVITTVQQNSQNLEINLGSLFYRCLGNSYTTRKSPFSTDFSQTTDFINQQVSGEGGDEAVEVALREAVNDYDWSEDAVARLIFIILDEPPSVTDAHIKTIFSAVSNASAKGIKIIPVFASGTSVNYDKSLEFLMRTIAIATNGTYVFLTNHSGVGGNHIAPETDEYDAEYLNKLFLRLINQNIENNPCSVDYTELLKTISDTTKVEIIEHVVLDSLSKPLIIAENKENNKADLVSNQNFEENTDDFTENENNQFDEISENSDLEVKSFLFYPNPTNGIVNIEINGDIETLYLTDQHGRILEKIIVLDSDYFQIDISKYADGLYYLMYLDNDSAFSGKLILLH